MANAVRLDRILEGSDNGLLPNHLIEYLRAKLSGNDLVFHSGAAAEAGQARGILWHIR
jgi:hypothetical protein